MTSNRAAPTSQCVARGKKFEEDIYLYLIAFEKQLASLPYDSKCIQWGMCWRLVLYLFLQKKLFAEFLNRERRAFTSKCLEYTLSFHFFQKLLLILPLQRKGVTYFLRAVEMNRVASGLTVTEWSYDMSDMSILDL